MLPITTDITLIGSGTTIARDVALYPFLYTLYENLDLLFKARDRPV